MAPIHHQKRHPTILSGSYQPTDEFLSILTGSCPVKTDLCPMRMTPNLWLANKRKFQREYRAAKTERTDETPFVSTLLYTVQRIRKKSSIFDPATKYLW